jgi:hypothetical protein
MVSLNIFVLITMMIFHVDGQMLNSSDSDRGQNQNVQNLDQHEQNSQQPRKPNQWTYNTERGNDTHLQQGKL